MQDAVVASPYATLLAVACVFAALLWAICVPYRKLGALRRTLAIEQAGRLSLQSRLEDATAALDSRLSRVEGGRLGLRGTERRREAIRSIREGADPAAAAQRCGLRPAELELLLELEDAATRAEGR